MNKTKPLRYDHIDEPNTSISRTRSRLDHKIPNSESPTRTICAFVNEHTHWRKSYSDFGPSALLSININEYQPATTNIQHIRVNTSTLYIDASTHPAALGPVIFKRKKRNLDSECTVQCAVQDGSCIEWCACMCVCVCMCVCTGDAETRVSDLCYLVN